MTDKMTLREAILITVNTRNGVNGVDLALNCMGLVNPFFDDVDYMFQLAELVSTGEVVSLDFHNPRSDRKLISLYFPKGTILYAQAQTDQAIHGNNAQGAGTTSRYDATDRMGMGAVSSRRKSLCPGFIQRIWRRITIRAIRPSAY